MLNASSSSFRGLTPTRPPARADDFPDYRAFMVEEHAEESVDFCLELREYMAAVAKGEFSHDELHERAHALYAKFLPQGAPAQINVSAKALKEARKALERGEVDPSIFARAQNEVCSARERARPTSWLIRASPKTRAQLIKLMARDNLARFLIRQKQTYNVTAPLPRALEDLASGDKKRRRSSISNAMPRAMIEKRKSMGALRTPSSPIASPTASPSSAPRRLPPLESSPPPVSR